MSVDYSTLPDDPSEWPEEARGWNKVKFTEFRAEPKGNRTWFLLQFDDGNGKRASLSQNLFSKPETDGEKTANRITMSKLKQFFVAAGLPEADLPQPSARDIARALNAYEGNATVDAFLGPDGRGYTEATKFRKVADAGGV